MAAFAAFRGPRTFCKGLLERERIGFTAAYTLSIGAFYPIRVSFDTDIWVLDCFANVCSNAQF